MDRRSFLAGAASAPPLALLAACTTAAVPGAVPASIAGTVGTTPTAGAAAATGVLSDAQVAAAVARLDDLIQKAMADTGVPGLSIAVVHDDKVLYAKGFGVKQVGTSDRVDENTVFQVASVSKSVGATGVASAVGDAKMAWSDPVVSHLPSFALADPYVTQHVSIADLYSHRSGLPEHAGDHLEDLGYDRAEVLARLRLESLDPFRITYHYTNFGMTAAAEAVATAAGTSWEALLKSRIYDPLGMTSTSSTFADFDGRPNKATGNMLTDGVWRPTTEQRQPDAQSAAGGVSSSAVDMAKWMRMVLADGSFEGRQVVKPEALAPVLTPQITSSPPRTFGGRPGFYGLGFNVGTDDAGKVRFSHSGAFTLGTGTAFTLVPADGLGMIVLTNGTPLGVAESLIASFLDLAQTGTLTADWLGRYRPIFEEMLANPSTLAGKTRPANVRAAQPATAYVGSFSNDYYGPANVAENGDGSLVLKLGPKPLEFPLAHWDGDVFTYSPPGENGFDIAAVTFTVAAAGQASSVVVENLDKTGLGTFTRT